MPVHLIGGLLGRFVGYLIYYMNGSNTIPDNTLIQVPGYVYRYSSQTPFDNFSQCYYQFYPALC